MFLSPLGGDQYARHLRLWTRNRELTQSFHCFPTLRRRSTRTLHRRQTACFTELFVPRVRGWSVADYTFCGVVVLVSLNHSTHFPDVATSLTKVITTPRASRFSKLWQLCYDVWKLLDCFRINLRNGKSGYHKLPRFSVSVYLLVFTPLSVWHLHVKRSLQ